MTRKDRFPVCTQAFVEAMNLHKPPTSLMTPRRLCKALVGSRRDPLAGAPALGRLGSSA